MCKKTPRNAAFLLLYDDLEIRNRINCLVIVWSCDVATLISNLIRI